jgi:hypothetical protein
MKPVRRRFLSLRVLQDGRVQLLPLFLTLFCSTVSVPRAWGQGQAPILSPTPTPRPKRQSFSGESIHITGITVTGAEKTNMRQNFPDKGIQNYGCVKHPTFRVRVQVITGPRNSQNEWNKIEWGNDGGTPYPAPSPINCFREYVIDTAQVIRVRPTIAQRGLKLNIWVIWSTVTNKVDGTTPTNAWHFGSTYPPTGENLGAYVVRFPDNTNVAVGKMVSIAQLEPTDIHSVALKAGWQFRRDVLGCRYKNGQRHSSPTDCSDSWRPDDTRTIPSTLGLQTKPDKDDRIYFTDGPSVKQLSDDTTCAEGYRNFRMWVEWNGRVASAYDPWPNSAKWSFQAKWQSEPPPIPMKKLSGTGPEIPYASQGCP